MIGGLLVGAKVIYLIYLLSDKTRSTVEDIFCKIESKLKEVMTNE